MQEEVENRSVNLAITTTRMTARAILSGIRTYLYYHNRNKASEIKPEDIYEVVNITS